jgi:hypothetical protein
MYQVFENNKPCDEIGYPELKGKGWTNSQFTNFEDARNYAWTWLGQYACMDDDGENGIALEPDKPVNYNGFGDMIEIKTIK